MLLLNLFTNLFVPARFSLLLIALRVLALHRSIALLLRLLSSLLCLRLIMTSLAHMVLQCLIVLEDFAADLT